MDDGRRGGLHLRRTRRWLARLLVGTLSVLGLVALVPAAPASALCTGRSWFGGVHYCPAFIEGVQSTRYGEGRRVWLDRAFVTEVTPTTVTVAQSRYVNDCVPRPEAPFCGAGITIVLVHLTVGWSGTHRPAYGTQLRLYGTTAAASLVPAGYVRTGYCTEELALADFC